MPRLRDPESLKDVCAQFRAILGVHATDIIARSPSVLHKAADPDDDYMLTTAQMLALDEACAIKAGLTPFFDYQKRRAGAASNGRVEPLPVAMLDAEVAMGKLAHSLRVAISNGGEDNASLSDNEANAIKQAAVKVMTELQDVLNSVSAARPDGPTHYPARKKSVKGRR